MADEVQIRQQVFIKSGNLDHQPRQREWKADMTGAKGPTPGAITATYDGTDIDLSQLTDPGWIDIYNQEPEDGGITVSWGVYDPETDRYYPVGKIAPGQGTGMLHLDELLQFEFDPATGTGTGNPTNRLRIKAKDGDEANILVQAFER